MAYTLSIDIAPDSNTNGDTTTAGISLFLAGTEYTLGSITSLTSTLPGAYRWSTHTFDVTSYFPNDVIIRGRRTAGPDTNHFRRVFITDGVDTWYDQYGPLWWNSPAPPYFTNVGFGSDPQFVGPPGGPVPSTYNDTSLYTFASTPGGLNGAFMYVYGSSRPDLWTASFI